MEELIKQAFLHVDVIGPHVQEGHYDLIGPNGEIILPSVWERVVEPDWSITMHMWPMDKAPLRHHPQMPPGGMPPGGMPRPGGHMAPGGGHPGHPPRPGAHFARPPSARPGGGGMPPPPPPGGMWPGMPGPMAGGLPPGMRVRPGMEPQIVQVEPGKPPRPVKKGSSGGGMLGWVMGGAPGAKKTSGKKYVSPFSVVFCLGSPLGFQPVALVGQGVC